MHIVYIIVVKVKSWPANCILCLFFVSSGGDGTGRKGVFDSAETHFIRG